MGAKARKRYGAVVRNAKNGGPGLSSAYNRLARPECPTCGSRDLEWLKLSTARDDERVGVAELAQDYIDQVGLRGEMWRCPKCEHSGAFEDELHDF